MATQTEPDLVRDLRGMDSYRFEELVADVWEAMGYRVHVRDESGDKGVDVEATHTETGEYVVIQAKCYSASNKIGRPAVQQYHSLYRQEGADNVVLVSTGYFAETAHESAKQLDVDLLNGTDLCGLLSDLEAGNQITQHYFGRTTPNQRRWGNNYFGKSTWIQFIVALLSGVYLLGAYGALTVTSLSPPVPDFFSGLFETFTVGGVPGSGLAILAAFLIFVVLAKWAYLWHWKAAGWLLPILAIAAVIVGSMSDPKQWMTIAAAFSVLFLPIVIPAMFSFTIHWRLFSGFRRGICWGAQATLIGPRNGYRVTSCDLFLWLSTGLVLTT